MFIYSVHGSTVKFFSVLFACVAILVAAVAFIPAVSAKPAAYEEAGVKFEDVKTNEDRIAFLSQFGWEVVPQCVEEVGVTIPADFDRVFVGYNQIQKEQGLDLSAYRRKEVTRYTYEVTNYPDYEGKVLANVLVYRGNVIGGDICSEAKDGFVHGFSRG